MGVFSLPMRWPWIGVGVALLGVVLVGCVDQPSLDHEVSGTFTENATQAQMNELAGEVEDRGGRLFQLESFPVQFRAAELSAEDCGQVQAFAAGADYVAEVGECERSEQTEDGDEPTDSGSG